MVCALQGLQAQSQVIDLQGLWLFAQGDKPEYNDRVTLPGSMLTNGKGNDVCTHTQWTGSLCDYVAVKNNRIPLKGKSPSTTKIGLKNLDERYGLLWLHPVVSETEHEFEVKIPVMEFKGNSIVTPRTKRQ